MNSLRYITLLLLIILVFYSCGKNKTLCVNGIRLNVEVADTKELRKTGLMFRKKLKKDSGMWFVFDRREVLFFWMKNTFIPLSVAFIDTNYKIISIADMSPLDESRSHSSFLPAKYAVEMNQGWFERKSIKVGDKVEGLE